MQEATQAHHQTTELFSIPWRTNLLYDDSYIESLLNGFDISEGSQAASILAWVQVNYNGNQFKTQSEAQLENAFIRPLLERLNWVLEPQISISVQGKNVRPDWALFQDASVLSEFRNNTNQPESQLAHIHVFLEAKDYSAQLDKSKTKHEKSPHQQLMEYLHLGRKRYGFLTNGRLWRFYDVEKISKTKSYLEIDLEAILSLVDIEEQRRAIGLFERLFAQANYLKTSKQSTVLEDLSRNAYEYASAAEENLKAVIYVN
jgi:predicted type IV restriction endonuclease